MAAFFLLVPSLFLHFSSHSSSSSNHYSPIHPTTMLIILLFISTLLLCFLFIFVFTFYSRKFNKPKTITSLKTKQVQKVFLHDNNEKNNKNDKAQLDIKQQGNGSKPTRLTRTILLEVLPADSPKWAEIFKGEGADNNGSAVDGERVGDEDDEEEEKKKKKKKRAKKKRPDPNGGGGGGGAGEEEGKKGGKKEELVCLYPFTTSSSAIQRKIKQQYDQLVKSHESNDLTLAQVGQFVNCLVEAKKELQHRSEAIQRKFTITKALLVKADRSSFDRLRQQIYKLELEQKRLEEDAFVYNWLQQQLKLSPAYKKMLEIGACMEMEDKLHDQVDSTDNEFADISFEELLAQEKKDAFWQRNGKTKSC